MFPLCWRYTVSKGEVVVVTPSLGLYRSVYASRDLPRRGPFSTVERESGARDDGVVVVAVHGGGGAVRARARASVRDGARDRDERCGGGGAGDIITVIVVVVVIDGDGDGVRVSWTTVVRGWWTGRGGVECVVVDVVVVGDVDDVCGVGARGDDARARGVGVGVGVGREDAGAGRCGRRRCDCVFA